MKHKWLNARKNFPEKDGLYLVDIESKISEVRFISAAWFINGNWDSSFIIKYWRLTEI